MAAVIVMVEVLVFECDTAYLYVISPSWIRIRQEYSVAEQSLAVEDGPLSSVDSAAILCC